MNPFDSGEPVASTFRLFLCAIASVWLLRRTFDTAPLPELEELNPYHIALMRRSPVDVIHLAIMSLVRRRKLRTTDEFVTSVRGAIDETKNLLELAILCACASTRIVHTIVDDDGVKSACSMLKHHSLARPLVPERPVDPWQRFVIGCGSVLFSVVSFMQMRVVFAKGYDNWLMVLGQR